MDGQGVTVKEIAAQTVREREQSSDVTLIYTGISEETSTAANNFRGWRVLEQLPTKGAEADIFIVSASGERRVLKLYRHRLEPKIEILNRITAISRANSHCFVTYFETGFDEATGRWYELQEFIQNGSVKDLPRDVKRSRNFIAQFIPELATAIQCLHDNGIIHCDIKPTNVLVRNLEPLDLVLADFGISSLVASDMSRKMTSLKGTPMYWAPEAFSKTISRACDWWGLGMMLLEMLAGEHPFEGMSDSEIIRKLTLGDVDVPEILGSDWSLLIKGLLTKDDSKRWGKAEVDRWRAGERNIPVHYSGGGAYSVPAATPFTFGGAEYRSVREIAEATAQAETPWASPADFLLLVRQWLEANGDFDRANAVAVALSRRDAETALFRFVHANAPLPFRVMGHEVNAEALAAILRRAASSQATEAEWRITEMLRDGKLAALYAEYANFGAADPTFMGLLDFLAKKTAAQQRTYLDAVINHGHYVWPPEASSWDAARKVQFFAAIGSPPLEASLAANPSARYILPDALIKMLGSTATYADGLRTLDEWQALGLLIGRGGDEPATRALSVSGYELAARAIRLGHTPEITQKMRTVREKISDLNRTYPSVAFQALAERIDGLKNAKLTPNETITLDKLITLLEKFDRAGGHRHKIPLQGAAAGALIGLSIAIWASVLGGNLFGFASIITFASMVILSLFELFSGGRMSKYKNMPFGIIALLHLAPIASVFIVGPICMAEPIATLINGRTVTDMIYCTVACLSVGASFADTFHGIAVSLIIRKIRAACVKFNTGGGD
jgi:tRNA A-37 threonylcarbamoyl transferase component Bud32